MIVPTSAVGPAARPGDWDRRHMRLVDGTLIVLCLATTIVAGLLAASSPLAVLALAVVVALVVLVAHDTDRATLLVVAVLYSNAAVVGVVVHGLPVAVGLGVPLLLLAPLLHRVLVLRRPLVGQAYLPWMLAFLGANLLAAVLARDPIAAFPSLLTFVSEGFFLFFLVLNVITSVSLLRRVLWVVVVVAGFLGALSLLQQATGTFHRDYLGFAQVNETLIDFDPSDWQLWDDFGVPEGQPRMAGPIGEKNFYSLILLVTFPLAAYFVASGRGAARMAALAAGACILGGVVLTMSRGAGVAVVITGLVLTVVGILPRRILLVFAAVGLVLLSLVPAYAERLGSLTNVGSVADERAASSQAADDSLRGRYSEMMAAARVFQDHPIVGVGPGQFASYYQEYSTGLGVNVHGSDQREAHNLYLDLAAELGILGLGAFLGLMVVITAGLLRVWRTSRDDPPLAGLATAVLTSLLLLLTSSLFLHLAYERYLWLILALAASLVVVAEQEHGVPSPDRARMSAA